jgi:hypothetical protein
LAPCHALKAFSGQSRLVIFLSSEWISVSQGSTIIYLKLNQFNSSNIVVSILALKAYIIGPCTNIVLVARDDNHQSLYRKKIAHLGRWMDGHRSFFQDCFLARMFFYLYLDF